MSRPEELGDRLGQAALGAAPGQTIVADSTSVLLYKLVHAALALRPERTEIVLDREDFPTDRYIAEGIAAERGLALRWIGTDPAAGLTPELVAAAAGPDTALVLASLVAYRSGHLADGAALTAAAHEAGALVLWDLSHAAGVVEVALDDWGADLAAGCSYKYLNGGPGAPAFAYVRRGLHDELRQPIQGWMGHAEPFRMGPGYTPRTGIRRMLSGTPPVLAMVPLRCGVELLEEAGIGRVRAKSVALTAFAVDLADAWLAPLGATVATPRDPARRGGHVTLRRPGFRDLLAPLRERGVIPDFREPDGLRIGLSPLSTSFTELHDGMAVLRELAAA